MNTLSWEIKNYVAKITLNRPEAKNAISFEMLRELRDVLENTTQSDARVLWITGMEDSFCAGADLKERRSMDETKVLEFLRLIQSTFLFLSEMKIPTIAAINGFAFGGGLELALSCDIRYASETAIMGLTETKLGIIPGAGGTQRLSRLVGQSTAMEWIFSGQKISARLAEEKGLVSKTCPKDSLQEETIDLVRSITESAPIAVAAAKKAIRIGMHLPFESSLQWEFQCYLDTLETEDRKEALKAFAEKRKPLFKGV